MATDSVTVSPTYNGDSVPLTAGMIVRLKPGANNNVVRAQADTAPHAQGVNGVVISGASAPTTGCVVVCTGKETVQMESGLTLAVGQTVYVSPNVAGKGTNVLPAVVVPIGTIADVSAYASSGTVEVDVVVNAGSSAGGGGAFPGYGTPGSIGPNEPTTGTSALVLRADSLPGQKIEAQWPIANVRWYAVDGTNGNDANAGFSDTSSAAAGLVAKKTLAGLGAIFPRVGAGRKVTVVVRAGSYIGQGGLTAFLSSVSGYAPAGAGVIAGPLVVVTDTNATASSVAFAGDANDRIFAGMTTAPGMNAAGYNPIASFSTTLVTCQLNGGGAPAFAAEPTVPMFRRLRFDSATATAALRNACGMVMSIPASNQLLLLSALPTVPTGADVFYLETAGAIIDSSVLSLPSPLGLPAEGIIIVGFKTTAGTMQVTGGSTPLFCGCDFAAVNVQYADILPFARYPDDTGTFRTVGMGLCCSSLNQINPFINRGLAQLAIGVTGALYLNGATTFDTFGNATSCWGGLQVDTVRSGVASQNDDPTSILGARSHVSEVASRVRGLVTLHGASAGLYILQSSLTLASIDIEGMGANPAIRLRGQCVISVSNVLVGSTGNTDVGLDLTSAVATNVLIYSAPTVTGTLGDVRLSDGTIISWVTAMAGVIDPAGNQLYSGTTAPLGTKVAAATTTVALGNVAPASVTSSTPTAWTPLVINGVKYLVPLWPST